MYQDTWLAYKCVLLLVPTLLNGSFSQHWECLQCLDHLEKLSHAYYVLYCCSSNPTLVNRFFSELKDRVWFYLLKVPSKLESCYTLPCQKFGICGQVVKDVDFKPLFPMLFVLRIPIWTFDSFMCGRYPASLLKVRGSTRCKFVPEIMPFSTSKARMSNMNSAA